MVCLGSTSVLEGVDEAPRPISPSFIKPDEIVLDRSYDEKDLTHSWSTSSASWVPSDSDDENLKHAPWRRLKQYATENAKIEEEWTTCMIRNIPNRYTQEWLLNEIQEVAPCNFLHLPQAKRTEANLGYAFVNFVSCEGARDFLAHFEGHQFGLQPNSKKRAAVSWAKLQGYQENVDFYAARRIAATDKKPWVL
jgi:hypothetical protein